MWLPGALFPENGGAYETVCPPRGRARVPHRGGVHPVAAILLGAVAPDPRPWNWPTVYIVDFLYGLALFSQLVGFLCRTSRNRLWTAAVGGYTALAFGQAALEALLDLLGVQPAPITAKWFIFLFMSAGLILGALMLLLAFRHGRYWTAFSLSQER